MFLVWLSCVLLFHCIGCQDSPPSPAEQSPVEFPAQTIVREQADVPANALLKAQSVDPPGIAVAVADKIVQKTASEKIAERPSDLIADSHQRMLARLREVQLESQDNPYFGRGALLAAKRDYDRAKSEGDFLGTLQAIESVGRELTFSGNPDDALKTYAQADRLLAVMRRSGAPPELITSWEGRIHFGKGIAGMRKAENENCVHCQDGEGCLFPIRPKGVHQLKQGAEIARDNFVEVIRRNPNNVAAVWLLNLAHMTLGTFPEGVPKTYDLPRDRLKSEVDFPWFANVALPLGLDTMSLSGGVIAEDFDGDHWLDLVVSEWGGSGQLRYFRNNGDGSFSDQTESANLAGIFGGLNLVQADYDNDGDIDVLVLRGAWLRETGNHPNSLLENDGSGRFRDVAYQAGLAGNDFPTQTAAWNDFDRDGDLDLMVGNEQSPSQLFQNNGNGTFNDIASKVGLQINSFVKGVAWGDIDEDGFPDLYVSNYMTPNRLFHNDFGEGFTDITEQSGVAAPKASFAVWFWDYNNDGNLDLFCPGYLEGVQHVAADYFEMDSKGQTDLLYQGNGDGTFTEVGQQRGFDHVSQTMGCNFGDLDNDGFLDIYLGTGYPGFEALMPNVMYRNEGGKSFQDVSVAGGFSHLQKGHAIAFADFDHDGDQDVFAELGGAYPGDGFRNALFENPGFQRHSLSVRLIGTESNSCAIGARIKATFHDDEQERSVYRWVGSGSSFGANPFRESIGTGNATKVDRLEITWPRSGKTQVFEEIDCDQLLLITEGDPQPTRVELVPTRYQTDRH